MEFSFQTMFSWNYPSPLSSFLYPIPSSIQESTHSVTWSSPILRAFPLLCVLIILILQEIKDNSQQDLGYSFSAATDQLYDWAQFINFHL